jgi:hypothetical protein
VRESRHYFEKISVDLDGALLRNSQAPRSRPTEVEEAQNLLSATRSCFRHTALDHVYCLSVLQAKKKPEVLGTVSKRYMRVLDVLCVFNLLMSITIELHVIFIYRNCSLLYKYLTLRF